MSNIGSSALTSSKQHTQTHPNVPSAPPAQKQFNIGTRNLLDEARGVVENAVGQGQQLNPLIYQMLGLDPQYEDHSADLTAAQQEMDAAQGQYNSAKETIATLSAVPKAKRSKEQRRQLAQLTRHMPGLEKSLGSAKTAYGQLETMPKTITGLSRLDPTQIPAESPFSAQNPLNQAQAAEAQRLNQYLAGGEVDPTLKHGYDAAEASLRAKLAQRFGPDYESSSVGQMALQNFSRQKNEAFATWNQQQVEKYNLLAFAGQANLQALLANRIGLMREPATTAMNEGAALSNLAGARLNEQQIFNQRQLGEAGVSTTTSNISPMPLIGAAGGLLNTPYTTTDPATGKTTTQTLGGQAISGVANVGSKLYDWATGAGAAGAASAYAPAGVSGLAGADAAVGGMSVGEGAASGIGALAA